MKTRVVKVLLLLLVAILTVASSCDGSEPTAEKDMAEQVNRQQAHYARVQPIPWFDYSLERYLMIQLYVARNNAVATWSYVWNDFLGIATFSCPSIGYPIPGGSELDNPLQVVEHTHYWATTIGQAEPNGLFPPGTSAGTYIMCLNPDGTVGPVYMEPNVQTYPYPMEEKDHRLVRTTPKSSISIDYKNMQDYQPIKPPTPTR